MDEDIWWAATEAMDDDDEDQQCEYCGDVVIPGCVCDNPERSTGGEDEY